MLLSIRLNRLCWHVEVFRNPPLDEGDQAREGLTHRLQEGREEGMAPLYPFPVFIDVLGLVLEFVDDLD